MARKHKVPPDKFAETYIEMKAEEKKQEEIAEQLGITPRTLRRYLKSDKYIRAMSDYDPQSQPNNGSSNDSSSQEDRSSPADPGDVRCHIGANANPDLKEIEDEINNKIRNRQDEKIKEGIEEGKRKADQILETAFQINMKRIEKALKKDDSVDKAGKIAKSLLPLADRFDRRNEAIQEIMQINFNQDNSGISEGMLFGALKYGLEPLNDQEAMNILERVENYLRERNAIQKDDFEVQE